MEENNKKSESVYTDISLWDSKAAHEKWQERSFTRRRIKNDTKEA